MKPDQTPFPCRFHWGLTQMYETTPNTQQCIRMIVDASHEFFFVMTDSISDFHQYLYIHQTRNSLCLHRQGWKFYLPTMKQMRLIRRHPIKQSCPWILFAIFINTVENLKIISRSISKSSYGFESIIKIFLVVEPLLSHKLWRYEQPLANYVRERHKIIKKNHPLSPHV